MTQINKSKNHENISSHLDCVVRFADKNGMKMVKLKNEAIMKECCLGCKFIDYCEWERQLIDTCYLCDKHGSMRQI